ncbi:MAG: acylphosphatase [Bdellovibrionales bacterium]|nr:acylphosphatase [Bdellovibrionales bacterium]
MNIPERIGVRFELRGRVQGVGCRAQVQRGIRTVCEAEGQDQAISGWVKNLPNGAVEVVIVGLPETVSRIEQFLGSGLEPPVQVEAVRRELLEVANFKWETGFKILRDEVWSTS